MKTQYFTGTTLDGFIATEDDSLDWLFALGDPADSSYTEFVAQVGALAMGSATYEWLLRSTEQAPQQTGPSWPYAQPTWVFTRRTLREAPGVDIRFVQGDVRDVHAQLRAAAGDKNIWLVGGGDLVGQFHDAGLLDEMIVQVASTTLGRGKPLLPRRLLSPVLRLVSVRQMGSTFVELTYDVTKGTPQSSDAS